MSLESEKQIGLTGTNNEAAETQFDFTFVYDPQLLLVFFDLRPHALRVPGLWYM